jgi:ADP-heptose:LPS heptosyltransferase
VSLKSRIHWHLNAWMQRRLRLLDAAHGWLSVLDSFGAPGDTLLAATVCRILKQHFPMLRLNLITQWPDLVRLDPCLDAVNAPETFFTLRFWYLETVTRKEASANVLLETLSKVGITCYEYRSRVHLSPEESQVAAERLAECETIQRPRLAFHTLSKEKVKNWPLASWGALLERLRRDFTLVHLGDDREPVFPGVVRFAGSLSMRESMAVLSHCHVFIGPVSFLMHAANGLDIPSVILYGGRETPANSGYAENINLYVPMPCGPCWLHDSRGDVCPFDIECMKRISVNDVEIAVRRQLQLSAR